MNYEHSVPIILPVYPTSFKVRSTDGEKIALFFGLVFIAGGTAFLLANEVIVATIFGGVGIIFEFFFIMGLISFYSGVRKNKDTFFNVIRDEVAKETDITMSNATIAAMWVEGSHRVLTHKFVAAGRKGKEFQVSIY